MAMSTAQTLGDPNRNKMSWECSSEGSDQKSRVLLSQLQRLEDWVQAKTKKRREKLPCSPRMWRT